MCVTMLKTKWLPTLWSVLTDTKMVILGQWKIRLIRFPNSPILDRKKSVSGVWTFSIQRHCKMIYMLKSSAVCEWCVSVGV